ncbi:hypothetical protein GF420_10650, partial [candidate division GN15 bacterium]|nr:hypothetical protein [candidate division GN15 bacterium]
MRKSWLMTLFLVLFAASFVSAERIELGSGADDVEVIVEQSNDSRTVVRFEVNGFDRTEKAINGSAWNLVDLVGEGELRTEGAPALPRVSRSIIIPDDARVAIRVLESDFVEFANTPVAPSKGNLLRTVNPDDVPFTFGPEYNKIGYFPETLASVRDPYILRDYRGTVIDLQPFQYDPSTRTLRVYTSVTVEVVSEGSAQVNRLDERSAAALTPDFELLYSRHFINYDRQAKYTPIMESGDMLIITYDNYRSAMQPLVDWKIQKGIKTTMVDVSAIGNNASAIETFIQNFYDTTNLAWVLLVGDYNHVATPQASGGASDPSYAKTAGGDDYPDLFIGRFSAESLADVETQVVRTIDYELNPMIDTWLHEGTGIASTEGPGHFNEYDHEHSGYIRDDLLAFTYTHVDEFYGYAASDADVSNALNAGRSFINYTGHGSTTSWSTTGFNNSDINNLTNAGRLPFIISVACVNGNFDGSTCFGEVWLRATDAGGNATGAIGAYMSSINQSWDPPMDAQDESTDLLVAEEKTTFGGICFNGSAKMIDVNGAAGVEMYDTWHIFGDPSVQLRTDIPATLTVTHDPVLLISDTEMNVVVDGVEGALCAVSYNGQLFGAAYTGTDGSAVIPFNDALPVGEDVTLTVTAFNGLPYVTTMTVITPSGPYVVYDSHENNDINGNGNGVVEAGESILTGVQLVNVGPDDAIGVAANITTTDPYVTITDGTEEYGTVTGNYGTGLVVDGFAFDIDGDAPDGHQITFDLEVTGTARDTWTGTFRVAVHAPVLQLVQVAFDDAGGNQNGILDPGESANLIVTIGNIGTGQAFSTEAYLSPNDSYLMADDNYSFFGVVDSLTGTAGNNSDPFTLTADETCPMGHEVTMDIDVTAGAYSITLQCDIVVGDRVVIFADDFSYDQGWTGLGGPAEWEIGVPSGSGGDPSSDHSPSADNQVLGNDLGTDGEYENNIGTTQWVTSPIIDCSAMTGTIMSFYRWLGVERNIYDHVYFEVYDGQDWVQLYENPNNTVEETSWTEEFYDLSTYADGNPSFQIRFGMGTTDGSVRYCGWNIDDIEIKAYGNAASPICEFADTSMTVTVAPNSSEVHYVTVNNVGEGVLRLSFSSNETWLECSTEPQLVDPGASLDFPITINCTGMEKGEYQGALAWTSNDMMHPSGSMPIYLTVSCCEGLTGNVDNDAQNNTDLADVIFL